MAYKENNTMNKLIQKAETFEQLQRELSKFGAWDSEPRNFFYSMLIRASKGEVWVEPKPESWQLYGMSGSKRAAIRLTARMRKIYAAVQKATVLEVAELKKWYRLF